MLPVLIRKKGIFIMKQQSFLSYGISFEYVETRKNEILKINLFVL